MYIGGIKISDEYEFKNDENILSNFEKINIFVGGNNSGKSRLLRSFILREGENKFYEFRINDFHQKLNKILNQEKNFFKIESVKFVYIPMLRGLRDIGEKMSDLYKSRTNEDYFPKYISTSTDPKNIPEGTNTYATIASSVINNDIDNKDIDNKDESFYQLNSLSNNNFIFTGQDIYQKIKSMLLGKLSERKLVSEFQEFLSKNFFGGNDFSITPNEEENILKVTIGNEEHSIHDLGDGIQSIIINTFPLFQYKNEPLVLLIEEPEMTMHPSMQRVLMETFFSFNNVQVFVTTHSNHFLDLVYDYEDQVSIFSFEEKTTDNQKKFKITNVTENSKVIDLLGVRNSSVYLANCVIWVEGITDRMFIKSLMKLSGKFENFKEDKHYTFAEYGGGNIAHFDFDENSETNNDNQNVNAISRKNFLVADNDGEDIKNGETEKAKRLRNLSKIFSTDNQNKNQKNFFADSYEIENLIPLEVWKILLHKIITSGKDIELKNLEEIDKTEFNNCLKTSQIGEVLKEFCIDKKNGKNPNYFNSKDIQCLGLTKRKFMKIFCEVVEDENNEISYDIFSNKAKNLIEKLLEFITYNN